MVYDAVWQFRHVKGYHIDYSFFFNFQYFCAVLGIELLCAFFESC